MLSCQPQIFYICKQYFSFISISTKVFLAWQHFFFFANFYEGLTAIYKCFTLGSHFLFFHTYDHLQIPCFSDIFYFSYLCHYLFKLGIHVNMYKIPIPMKC